MKDEETFKNTSVFTSGSLDDIDEEKIPLDGATHFCGSVSSSN